MQKLTILILFLTSAANASSIDFQAAQKLVLEHEFIKSSKHQAMAQEESSKALGAWGDPTLSVGAANLPIDKDLRRDVTPMSGIVFGIAQKIPLGAKLSRKEEAARQKAKEMFAQSEFNSQRLLANLWLQLVNFKRYSSDLKFLKENETWIKSMVQVSKKLYSNGKITQQALLDIRIRHNQILSSISDKSTQLAQINSNLSYLIGEGHSIKPGSIPWDKLKLIHDNQDYQERSFEAAVSAAELEKSAAAWSKLPEATVSLNYTKRSNIDNNGDFVGLTFSMPLPFGDTTSSAKATTAKQWLSAKSKLHNYRQQRDTTLQSLQLQANGLEEQIALTNKSLNFARTARETSARSYRIGGISYFDLLQAELRLQEVEFKSNELQAKLSENYIQQKLWHGDLVIK